MHLCEKVTSPCESQDGPVLAEESSSKSVFSPLIIYLIKKPASLANYAFKARVCCTLQLQGLYSLFDI